MNDAIEPAVVVILLAAWVLLIVFGIRNLIRAEHSPHWMWLSLCSPLLTLVIFLVSLVLFYNHREKLARQEAAAQKRAAEQHAAAQRALSLRLSGLVSDATQTAGSLPALVRAAENALDLAEREFEEGTFAPFWDAVEQATRSLANFEVTTQSLIQKSEFYNGEAAKLERPPPPFRLGVDTLPDATRTANRLRIVVRRAQKDFHFATIYEQRKTNQLLVAGFSTLGQAINDLGYRLGSSLEQLSSALRVGIAEMVTSHERATSALTTELERSREQAERDSDARRDHERKEQDMLDNIQRGRKPWP